jgi:hypothetical protein
VVQQHERIDARQIPAKMPDAGAEMHVQQRSAGLVEQALGKSHAALCHSGCNLG